MRAAALFLLSSLAFSSSSARAFAQASEGPIVMVLDAGDARVSGERLRHAVAENLGREVLRIVDERASSAFGTLTVAYEGSQRWLIRFESAAGSLVRHERVTHPVELGATVARAAAPMVADLSRPRPSERPLRAPDDDFYLAWADEILDPFVHLPLAPRREVALFSEVLDPFAPPAARHAVWGEVLDPWTR